jgi:hypothetical protein
MNINLTKIKTMETNINEIEVNGVQYVRKDSVKNAVPPVNTDGLPYVLIRSRDSGVHAGYLKERNSETSVTLVDSRRLWQWYGAATLSQVAQEGVKEPDKCKFPMAVAEIEVIGICEVTPCTDIARNSIEGVKIWKR